MTDVDRVRGPSGAPEPPKKKKNVDREAFEELMRMQKTPETDPEEQRKRKQQHEIEEDASAETVQSSSVKEDQSVELDAEAFSLSREKGKASDQLTRPETLSSIEGKKAKAKKEDKRIKVEQRAIKEQAAAKTKKEDTARGEIKEKAEEKEEQMEGVTTLPPGGWEAPLEKIKEEKKQVEAISAKTEQDLLFAGKQLSLLSEAVSGAAPYLRLSTQVMEIFERIVGVLTVMTQEGITKTTMTLDSPHFANSLLFGSEIVITEYSTAPKAFNIEFLGTPQAVNLMQGNIEELLAAFSAGHYTFKVNRIEASLFPSTRRVDRKVPKPKKKK